MGRDNMTIRVTGLPAATESPQDPMLEDILLELFTQVAPVHAIDLITTGSNRSAYVEFAYPESVEYSIKCMENVKLYGKQLVCTKDGNNDVSANFDEQVSRERYDKPKSFSFQQKFPKKDKKSTSNRQYKKDLFNSKDKFSPRWGKK